MKNVKIRLREELENKKEKEENKNIEENFLRILNMVELYSTIHRNKNENKTQVVF